MRDRSPAFLSPREMHRDLPAFLCPHESPPSTYAAELQPPQEPFSKTPSPPRHASDTHPETSACSARSRRSPQSRPLASSLLFDAAGSFSICLHFVGISSCALRAPEPDRLR